MFSAMARQVYFEQRISTESTNFMKHFCCKADGVSIMFDLPPFLPSAPHHGRRFAES